MQLQVQLPVVLFGDGRPREKLERETLKPAAAAIVAVESADLHAVQAEDHLPLRNDERNNASASFVGAVKHSRRTAPTSSLGTGYPGCKGRHGSP